MIANDGDDDDEHFQTNATLEKRIFEVERESEKKIHLQVIDRILSV